jgi:hypothetical protein
VCWLYLAASLIAMHRNGERYTVAGRGTEIDVSIGNVISTDPTRDTSINEGHSNDTSSNGTDAGTLAALLSGDPLCGDSLSADERAAVATSVLSAAITAA